MKGVADMCVGGSIDVDSTHILEPRRLREPEH
jgi:hypothetical protein